MSLLYKYYPISRKQFLENFLVRFTQHIALNDPFELSPYFELSAATLSSALKHAPTIDDIDKHSREVADKELKKNGIDKSIVPAGLYEAAIQKCKDVYAKNAPSYLQSYLSNTLNDFFNELQTSIGVFCLTEDPSNLLMWAHYADSHNGFVVGFDREHDFFTKGKGFMERVERVTYRKNRPQFSPLEADMHFLYTKGMDWAYEQEWRLYKKLESPNKLICGNPCDIYLYEVPTDCIRSVIIGARVGDSDVKEIHDLIGKSNLCGIDVLNASLSTETFGLEIAK